MSQFYENILGIHDLEVSHEIIILNPVDEMLHIISNIDLSSADIKIYDLQGRLVSHPNKYYNDLFVGGLISGVYMLHVQINGARYIKRFIKK